MADAFQNIEMTLEDYLGTTQFIEFVSSKVTTDTDFNSTSTDGLEVNVKSTEKEVELKYKQEEHTIKHYDKIKEIIELFIKTEVVVEFTGTMDELKAKLNSIFGNGNFVIEEIQHSGGFKGGGGGETNQFKIKFKGEVQKAKLKEFEALKEVKNVNKSIIFATAGKSAMPADEPTDRSAAMLDAMPAAPAKSAVVPADRPAAKSAVDPESADRPADMSAVDPESAAMLDAAMPAGVSAEQQRKLLKELKGKVGSKVGSNAPTAIG